MNFDPSQLAQYGVAGLMLGVFVVLHFKSLKRSEGREEQMNNQLSANRKECREDAAGLVTRIQTLENRQHEDTVRIARTCAEALRMNAEAYKKSVEAVTDRLPAIRDGK